MTLVTGDRVRVFDAGDGRQIQSIEPGPGRDHIGFDRMSADGRDLLLPLDAVPLIAPGRLDRRLFDV